MKDFETYIENVNFMGKEVENLQEVRNGMAAGMSFADKDGVCFSNITDENGEFREATEQETLDRIKTALENNEEVYMGWYLGYEYQIVKRRATTLQSDYSVGQPVYIMHGNKICATKIHAIILKVEVKEHKEIYTSAYKLYYPYSDRIYSSSEIFSTKEELVDMLLRGK